MNSAPRSPRRNRRTGGEITPSLALPLGARAGRRVLWCVSSAYVSSPHGLLELLKRTFRRARRPSSCGRAYAREDFSAGRCTRTRSREPTAAAKRFVGPSTGDSPRRLPPTKSRTPEEPPPLAERRATEEREPAAEEGPAARPLRPPRENGGEALKMPSVGSLATDSTATGRF